jgi:hypothetical protein
MMMTSENGNCPGPRAGHPVPGPWTKTIGLAVGLILLSVLAACGGGKAATRASSAPSTTATSSPGRPASAHTNANILLYNLNSDGPYYQALVTGAIGDVGPAVAVYPNGSVDQEHNSEMELQLSRGTFRLNIAQLDKEFFSLSAPHYPTYPATCSDLVSFTIPVPIVADSGTGLYGNITGSFAITLTAEEVFTRPCNPPAGRPTWEVIILAGSGTVSL